MKRYEGRMEKPKEQIYEFGEFRVDTARRALHSRDGLNLPLTPKVFDTLLYMLEHRE